MPRPYASSSSQKKRSHRSLLKYRRYKGAFGLESEKFLFFSLFLFLPRSTTFSNQSREKSRKRSISSSMVMLLSPHPHLSCPPWTFFTPNYFPRERENAVHFSPLITFFFFFFFSLVVTSCCFVASLHIQEATWTGIYAVRPWKHSFVRPEFSDLKLMDDGVESWTPLPLPTSVS